MSEAASQLLTPDEIRDLTGCEMPSAQLKRLQRAGFWLAWRAAGGRVVLPRAHYLAVCAGARPQVAAAAADAPRPKVKPTDWKPRQRAVTQHVR